MIRTNTALRAGVAFAALIGGSTAAQAQTTQPPADISQAPATAAPPTQGGEIVITGSRIRRNPLDLDAPRVFLDSQDIAKTGLNSINDVLQRLPSSGGGLNSKFNASGNLGNPPDGGGVGAGAAEVDLRYLGTQRAGIPHGAPQGKLVDLPMNPAAVNKVLLQNVMSGALNPKQMRQQAVKSVNDAIKAALGDLRGTTAAAQKQANDQARASDHASSTNRTRRPRKGSARYSIHQAPSSTSTTSAWASDDLAVGGART